MVYDKHIKAMDIERLTDWLNTLKERVCKLEGAVHTHAAWPHTNPDIEAENQDGIEALAKRVDKLEADASDYHMSRSRIFERIGKLETNDVATVRYLDDRLAVLATRLGALETRVNWAPKPAQCEVNPCTVQPPAPTTIRAGGEEYQFRIGPCVKHNGHEGDHVDSKGTAWAYIEPHGVPLRPGTDWPDGSD